MICVGNTDQHSIITYSQACNNQLQKSQLIMPHSKDTNTWFSLVLHESQLAPMVVYDVETFFTYFFKMFSLEKFWLKWEFSLKFWCFSEPIGFPCPLCSAWILASVYQLTLGQSLRANYFVLQGCIADFIIVLSEMYSLYQFFPTFISFWNRLVNMQLQLHTYVPM